MENNQFALGDVKVKVFDAGKSIQFHSDQVLFRWTIHFGNFKGGFLHDPNLFIRWAEALQQICRAGSLLDPMGLFPDPR
jgi:hypothetical protein